MTPTNLLLLAAAVGGAAYLLRKKEAPSAAPSTQPDSAPTPSNGANAVPMPPIPPLPPIQATAVGTFKIDPLCLKYPGGSWAEGMGQLEGYPPESPGWTPEEAERVLALARDAVADEPAFESLADAKEIAFQRTRQVVGDLCPALQLPDADYKVDEYAARSLAFRWLWEQVYNVIWNKLTAPMTGM